MGACVTSVENTRSAIAHAPVVRRPFRAPGRSARAVREYQLGVFREMQSAQKHADGNTNSTNAEAQTIEDPFDPIVPEHDNPLEPPNNGVENIDPDILQETSEHNDIDEPTEEQDHIVADDQALAPANQIIIEPDDNQPAAAASSLLARSNPGNPLAAPTDFTEDQNILRTPDARPNGNSASFVQIGPAASPTLLTTARKVPTSSKASAASDRSGEEDPHEISHPATPSDDEDTSRQQDQHDLSQYSVAEGNDTAHGPIEVL